MAKGDGVSLLSRVAGCFHFVLILWIVFVVDQFTTINLNHYGIIPRTVEGLKGILFAPFLHRDLLHIFSNTPSLLLFMIVLFVFFERRAFRVAIVVSILGGALVWCFGRMAYHIGASIMIYGLAGFLMAIGFFQRSFKSIIISIIVMFTHWTLVKGILPINNEGISWEGHLFGALAGVITAGIFRNDPKLKLKREKKKVKQDKREIKKSRKEIKKDRKLMEQRKKLLEEQKKIFEQQQQQENKKALPQNTNSVVGSSKDHSITNDSMTPRQKKMRIQQQHYKKRMGFGKNRK